MRQIGRALLVASATLFGFFVFSSYGYAISQASVTVEQVSPSVLGSWSLLSSDGPTHASSDVGANKINTSMAMTAFGPTTLIITPPTGMIVKISVYRGGDLFKSVNTPQYSFNLYPNDKYRFLVQYSPSGLGSLGITSNPSGVQFRMKGPTKTYTAKTPFTFKAIPSGRYSVLLAGTKDCSQPAPHAAVVEPETRNTVHVTLNCDKPAAVSEVNSSRPTKRSLIDYVEEREYKTRGNRK